MTTIQSPNAGPERASFDLEARDLRITSGDNWLTHVRENNDLAVTDEASKLIGFTQGAPS